MLLYPEVRAACMQAFSCYMVCANMAAGGGISITARRENLMSMRSRLWQTWLWKGLAMGPLCKLSTVLALPLVTVRAHHYNKRALKNIFKLFPFSGSCKHTLCPLCLAIPAQGAVDFQKCFFLTRNMVTGLQKYSLLQPLNNHRVKTSVPVICNISL